MKLYPAEFVVTLLYGLFATIISAPICFMGESNLSAWRLKPDVELASIVYSVRLQSNRRDLNSEEGHRLKCLSERFFSFCFRHFLD